jgi:hypothetical protein
MPNGCQNSPQEGKLTCPRLSLAFAGARSSGETGRSSSDPHPSWYDHSRAASPMPFPNLRVSSASAACRDGMRCPCANPGRSCPPLPGVRDRKRRRRRRCSGRHLCGGLRGACKACRAWTARMWMICRFLPQSQCAGIFPGNILLVLVSRHVGKSDASLEGRLSPPPSSLGVQPSL